MKKEGRQGVSELLAADLFRISESQAKTYDLRLYTLSELAKLASRTALSMIESGLMPAEALMGLSSFLPTYTTDFGEESSLSENPKHLLRAMSFCDRVAFIELLLLRLSELSMPIELRDFFPEEERDYTVTYMKGALADEAFDLFSEYIKDSTVAYCESIREGAYALSDGKVSFLILPLEERGGARIPTVASLIDRLSLKIAAVTPVYGFMGDADMKYALLSTSFIIPKLSPDDDLYVELSISDISRLSELLFALESYSHEVYRLFSAEGGEGKGGVTLILRASTGGVIPLICYLTVFICDFSLVGIYKNLE